MSTQLILYPQNYRGYSSTLTPMQFLVDGISFNSINTSTSYDATNTPANLGVKQAIIFQNATGIIVNTWYRVRSNWTGSPALPLQSSGNLVLEGISPGSFCGVYQRLSNLIVGGVYNVTVDWAGLVAPGYLQINHYNGTTLNQINSAGFANASLPQITWSFGAQTPNDIISFSLVSSVDSTLTISNISITTSVIDPTQVFTDLVDGQVICDLYQEEDIPLTLSIDDFKNVAEQVKSYSKDFDLPATKRNNQIFNNMFEIIRADDGLIFNPYVRTRCVLKQDGFVLFEGYLKMIDIKDKEGEISYNVNLFSEVIAMADILKDATFSDLDFSELAHNYNKASINSSWYNSTGLPLLNTLSAGSFAYDPGNLPGDYTHTNVLKYPFIDWTHQYIIGGTNSPSNNANVGYPELTSLEQAFRPCIQLKYLINKIFAASGFNWTSNFFNSADFGKLFMDFNWGADVVPVVLAGSGTGYGDSAQLAISTFTTIQTPNENFSTDVGYAAGVFTATQDSQTYNISYDIYYVTYSSSWTLNYRWKWYHASTGVYDYIDETLIVGVAPTPLPWPTMSGSFTRILMTGDTLSMEWKSLDSPSTGIYTVYSVAGIGQVIVSTSSPSITTDVILQTLRGEVGQWDFLKGIMTMFNLVSLVDESNPDNILIEPYADIFINNTNSGSTGNLTLAARSIQHDWTDKIDASEMGLRPLTDLNKKTIFKFVEDDDDHVFNVFKKAQSGHLYGSLEIDASGFTILEGTEEIIAEPFAATVSKPIDAAFSSFIVPSIYAMTDEGTEGFDNSPRIFYNNGVKSTGITYYIPEQNGLSSGNEPNFLQFSHLSAIPTVVSSPPAVTDTRDFVFTSAQLVSALGTPPVNNLYNTYWSPYFNELYNADTRTMTLKVNLSPSDIAAFKFFDTVFIKNRSFRVNKIEYKPNSLAKVEFILIP